MVTLGDVIRRVESNNDPYALRFEVTVYDRMLRKVPRHPVLFVIQETNKCSSNTAGMIAATSWGAWQLMGFNVYGTGRYTRPIAQFLGSVAEQNLAAGYFLDAIGYSADQDFARIDVINFARLYNGPGNVSNYAAKMQAAAHKLSKGAIGALI